MSFTFDFSGEDFSEGDDDNFPKQGQSTMSIHQEAQERGDRSEQDWKAGNYADRPGELVQARSYNIREYLRTLPSQISYSTTMVKGSKSSSTMERTLILRRALFDVKMQAMAEADIETINRERESGKSDPLLEKVTTDLKDLGLGDSDIENDVYEGGFKSWEGATDLAEVLLSGDMGQNLDETGAIVELGAGTALPTLVLFQAALGRYSIPTRRQRALSFTLADYNESVLRLVTLPNLLLVWTAFFMPSAFGKNMPSLDLDTGKICDGDGELEITPPLINAFSSFFDIDSPLSDNAKGLDPITSRFKLNFISGPWSDHLAQEISSFIDSTVVEGEASNNILVLAAETIYSTSSLPAFTSTVLQLINPRKVSGSSPHVVKDSHRSRKQKNTAVIAAKKMYFGVGGGIDEFSRLVKSKGGKVEEIWSTGSEGVGRCVLEVLPPDS